MSNIHNELFELSMSDKAIPLLELIKKHCEENVKPIQEEFYALQNGKEDRWTWHPRQLELLEGAKDKAKALGLWNFFLPDSEGIIGDSLTNLDYTYIASEIGKYPLASESMNCSAPDTGNMEVLERVGTPEQKKEWLEPLLNGEIRSAYAMTEPNLASSDAKNISTSAVLDGDEWVINGEKFYISGAGDPRCKIMIVMVKSSPDAAPSKQQSQILVPKDTPGVEILEGTIGKAEVALELMVKRAGTREAFGKPIAKLGGNLEIISRARIEINAMRLSVLQAAKAMDVLGNKEARVYVSAIKAMVPEKACLIIDQAIQMHGAAGISQWTPLAGLYTDIRHLRFADGPDEVHHMVVGRAELQKYDLW